MTARNSLKRLIRARMRNTGESYSSARRYIHTEGIKMTNATIELQPDLWPDWVLEHPWLASFLARTEAEARNRGDTHCDHFHMELAYLGLGPPVSDWLATLGLDVPVLREDIVEILGVNAMQAFGSDRHADRREAWLARGERARAARRSDDPVAECPLESVDEIYAVELLELARAEAALHCHSVDERHFLIASAMLLFAGSPPPVSALRSLTGLWQSQDTSYDVRADDEGQWMRDLAKSHGANPTRFPYDLHGPRG